LSFMISKKQQVNSESASQFPFPKRIIYVIIFILTGMDYDL
jgi:hypothetical protein